MKKKQKPHTLYTHSTTTSVLVCYECNWEWKTYSRLVSYTCPSCNTTSTAQTKL